MADQKRNPPFFIDATPIELLETRQEAKARLDKISKEVARLRAGTSQMKSDASQKKR